MFSGTNFPSFEEMIEEEIETRTYDELIITEDQNSIYFTIKDFGIGMHKEQIKKIIKPLYRGRTAKEKSKSGFGLGLAITKKIVEAHAGQLKIRSVINKGSEFTLSLPKEVDEKR